MERTSTDRTSTTRRIASAGAWAFLAAVYLIVAWGWLWAYDIGSAGGRAYAAAALAAFLVRVLGVHIGLGGIVVLGMALLLRRWRYAAACVPVVAFLLWPVHGGLVGTGTATSTDDAELVVMSVNLRRGADGRDALLRQVTRVDPDVLVLQEYTDTWHAELAPALATRFPFAETVERPDPQGIATYSKLAFEDGGGRVLQLGAWDVPAIRTVVRPDGEAVVILNAHLAMPLSINAHAEQRRQVERLARIVRNEQHPAIVVGDLNHTETTRHFTALEAAGLDSVWDQLHGGRGETWRRPGLMWLPGLRLDHVLVSDGVEPVGIRRGERGQSDHWPLITGLDVSDG